MQHKVVGPDNRWIQTFTGKRFNIFFPQADDFAIEDIAHALSLICRFTGHCRDFYSVAQHCVLCAQQAKPASKLLALMHDCAEAYIGDINGCYKRDVRIGDETAKQFERELMCAAFRAFKIPLDPVLWQEVQRVDMLLLATEARDLMATDTLDWYVSPKNGFTVMDEKIDRAVGSEDRRRVVPEDVAHAAE